MKESLQPAPKESESVAPTVAPQMKSTARSFFFGGLLPVIAFTLVEEIYGTKGGLIAGIVFGAGEMIWEYKKLGRVQGITIAGNLLVVILGLFSLWEDNSVWFKLQPSIILVVFALFLIGSSLLGKPFLVEMAKKQHPDRPPEIFTRLKGLNLRTGVAVLAIAALTAYAAFYWSTAAWAFLKGLGTPILLGAYIGSEVLVARARASRLKR